VSDIPPIIGMKCASRKFSFALEAAGNDQRPERRLL